jgi:hypothetical protein
MAPVGSSSRVILTADYINTAVFCWGDKMHQVILYPRQDRSLVWQNASVRTVCPWPTFDSIHQEGSQPAGLSYVWAVLLPVASARLLPRRPTKRLHCAAMRSAFFSAAVCLGLAAPTVAPSLLNLTKARPL